MKTVIVPLDGSELAEQALPLASTIAKEEDAQIVLTTAIAAPDRWGDDGKVREWEAEQQANANGYLQRIVERLHTQKVRARTAVEFGRPQIVIQAAADRQGADLIVMTTHGRSGVSRWTMGSVADKVLRTTSTPLILIHPQEHASAPASIERIAVALDGSALAEKALPVATGLAHTMNAPLLLIRTVVATATLYGGEGLPGALPVLGDMEAEAKQYLDGMAKPLRKRGLTVDVAVAVGVPAVVIQDLARDAGADLVVMTTHGRSGIDRWMFGSVADAVVRHGDVPVLVVRSWESLTEEEPPAIPVAGTSVVPAPKLTETRQHGAPPEARRDEPRPHRPERSPGR